MSEEERQVAEQLCKILVYALSYMGFMALIKLGFEYLQRNDNKDE